jgi:hypothetical protein
MPNDVVKSRAEIMQALPDDDAKKRWRFRDIRNESDHLLIDIFFENDATLVLMPRDFGPYNCEVFFRSDNLIVDTLKGLIHSEPSIIAS